MARMLINCATDEDAAALRSFAETRLRVEPILARTDEEVARVLRNQTIHLMVRHSRRSTAVDLSFARTLRRIGYARPIILIAREIGETPLGEDQGVCLLEQPFEQAALRGLALKLLSNRSVPQQVFRRFAVDLNAVVETFISGDKIRSQMFNVSRGGAYLEVAARPDVRVGDLVRLRVWLDQIERERTVNGRVVWLTGRGHAAGGYGLGLKFMKSGEALLREVSRT